MNRTLILTNQLSSVETVQAELEEFLASRSVPSDTIQTVALITEELLVNTISYGYAEQQRLADITLEVLIVDGPGVQLVFHDDALAFDPLTHPDPEPSDERVGGWGLPLVRRLCPKANYQRSGGRNILTLEVEPNALEAS